MPHKAHTVGGSCHLSLLRRFKQQVEFNCRHTPFYKECFPQVDLDSWDDFESFLSAAPLLQRRVLKQVPARDFLPTPHSSLMHFGTGGTTGRPVSIFYSTADWARAIESHRLAFAPFFHSGEIVAYNNYQQGHIAGPAFSDAIRALGGLPINRTFSANDEAALDELILHRCNVIIAPAMSSRKGGSLRDLIDIDAANGRDYINGHNIRAVIVSSTSLTEDVREELASLGIENIINCYGSTELMPVAISCPVDPLRPHLVEGDASCVILDDDQRMVQCGQRGHVVVSRVGTEDAHGNFTPATSTALINFLPGDKATLHADLCPCGNSSPRLSDFQRVSDVEEKEESGCQVWHM